MTSVFRQELIMEAPVCPNFNKAFQPCHFQILRGTGNGRIKEQALVVRGLGEKKMKDLAKKRKEKVANQQAADENLEKQKKDSEANLEDKK